MMSILKKFSIILGTVILLLLVYGYMDHRMIKLKYGYSVPLLLDHDQLYEIPLRIKVEKHIIPELDVSISDLYYLPESHEIDLGLWYKKWQHNSKKVAHRVFDVTFQDENGQVYNQQSFAKEDGLLDRFQYRSVEEIDLSRIKELYLVISLMEQQGDQASPVKTKKITIFTNGLDIKE